MFQIIILSCLVAMILAAPQDVTILRYDNDNNGLDSYNFAYETSDGTSRSEQGQLKNPGTENEALSVTGTFQYLGPDGVLYKVDYIADENGFQPTGDHIPKPL
ncbi:endocuticle structural glycoprotein ABD-5-like isoform X1 [Arctopsyche grandis]|uniref:endocuticle structural glycoprotein ABD-5-like isoform X1 n=1 Tax=Arctopsyche grandis TaxID=121162 RepID=UPI00406D8CC6